MKVNAFAVALIALVLSTGASLNATTFGEPDGVRHPYVGTLLFETASGYYSCTGTLVSPTVVLTAGHCTSEHGIRNLNTWVTFAPSISLESRKHYASWNDFLNDKKNGWIKGEAIPHPEYDDFAQFPVTYDIGVVLLKRAVTAATYGALPPQRFLETIRSAAENSFTVVGYGMQGYIKPFYGDLYERYLGTVRLVELKSTSDGGQSAKFTNNPGIGGGSCYGDSGGPVFYGNSNMVVAVVSWGNTPCIGVDYNFRVDTPVALDFVRQYMK